MLRTNSIRGMSSRAMAGILSGEGYGTVEQQSSGDVPVGVAVARNRRRSVVRSRAGPNVPLRDVKAEASEQPEASLPAATPPAAAARAIRRGEAILHMSPPRRPAPAHLKSTDAVNIGFFDIREPTTAAHNDRASPVGASPLDANARSPLLSPSRSGVQLDLQCDADKHELGTPPPPMPSPVRSPLATPPTAPHSAGEALQSVHQQHLTRLPHATPVHAPAKTQPEGETRASLQPQPDEAPIAAAADTESAAAPQTHADGLRSTTAVSATPPNISVIGGQSSSVLDESMATSDGLAPSSSSSYVDESMTIDTAMMTPLHVAATVAHFLDESMAYTTDATLFQSPQRRPSPAGDVSMLINESTPAAVERAGAGALDVSRDGGRLTSILGAVFSPATLASGPVTLHQTGGDEIDMRAAQRQLHLLSVNAIEAAWPMNSRAAPVPVAKTVATTAATPTVAASVAEQSVEAVPVTSPPQLRESPATTVQAPAAAEAAAVRDAPAGERRITAPLSLSATSEALESESSIDTHRLRTSADKPSVPAQPSPLSLITAPVAASATSPSRAGTPTVTACAQETATPPVSRIRGTPVGDTTVGPASVVVQRQDSATPFAAAKSPIAQYTSVTPLVAPALPSPVQAQPEAVQQGAVASHLVEQRPASPVTHPTAAPSPVTHTTARPPSALVPSHTAAPPNGGVDTHHANAMDEATETLSFLDAATAAAATASPAVQGGANFNLRSGGGRDAPAIVNAWTTAMAAATMSSPSTGSGGADTSSARAGGRAAAVAAISTISDDAAAAAHSPALAYSSPSFSRAAAVNARSIETPATGEHVPQRRDLDGAATGANHEGGQAPPLFGGGRLTWMSPATRVVRYASLFRKTRFHTSASGAAGSGDAEDSDGEHDTSATEYYFASNRSRQGAVAPVLDASVRADDEHDATSALEESVRSALSNERGARRRGDRASSGASALSSSSSSSAALSLGGPQRVPHKPFVAPPFRGGSLPRTWWRSSYNGGRASGADEAARARRRQPSPSALSGAAMHRRRDHGATSSQHGAADASIQHGASLDFFTAPHRGGGGGGSDSIVGDEPVTAASSVQRWKSTLRSEPSGAAGATSSSSPSALTGGTALASHTTTTATPGRVSFRLGEDNHAAAHASLNMTTIATAAGSRRIAGGGQHPLLRSPDISMLGGARRVSPLAPHSGHAPTFAAAAGAAAAPSSFSGRSRASPSPHQSNARSRIDGLVARDKAQFVRRLLEEARGAAVLRAADEGTTPGPAAGDMDASVPSSASASLAAAAVRTKMIAAMTAPPTPSRQLTTSTSSASASRHRVAMGWTLPVTTAATLAAGLSPAAAARSSAAASAAATRARDYPLSDDWSNLATYSPPAAQHPLPMVNVRVAVDGVRLGRVTRARTGGSSSAAYAAAAAAALPAEQLAQEAIDELAELASADLRARLAANSAAARAVNATGGGGDDSGSDWGSAVLRSRAASQSVLSVDGDYTRAFEHLNASSDTAGGVRSGGDMAGLFNPNSGGNVSLPRWLTSSSSRGPATASTGAEHAAAASEAWVRDAWTGMMPVAGVLHRGVRARE